MELLELNNCKPRKREDNIFHIMNQKGWRVPWGIGHCHLCLDGHWKLHVQTIWRFKYIKMGKFNIFVMNVFYSFQVLNKQRDFSIKFYFDLFTKFSYF